MTTLRRCASCGSEKPEDARFFSRVERCIGGLDPTCKACRAAQKRQRDRERLDWWAERRRA